MSDLSFSRDAFSHSQVKSKLWLAEHLRRWYPQHMQTEKAYTLNWYGSWIGLGPFILLTQLKIKLQALHLFELSEADLENSKKILNYWSCENLHMEFHLQDVNQIVPDRNLDQFFINTSCEHIASDRWLKQIPSGSFVLFQSTDMPHIEHINCARNLAHFREIYEDQIHILDVAEIGFSYPDKSFIRFMLFGTKR